MGSNVENVSTFEPVDLAEIDIEELDDVVGTSATVASNMQFM